MIIPARRCGGQDFGSGIPAPQQLVGRCPLSYRSGCDFAHEEDLQPGSVSHLWHLSRPTAPKKPSAGAVQLEAALRAGKDQRTESLFFTYPNVAEDPEAAIELVYTEFVIRQKLGQNPTPEEWYARFPRWKADLEQMFQVHDVLCMAETSLPTLSRGGPAAALHGRVGQTLRIPGYVILEEIGRGGMGVVYKAMQSKLNRTVALKVILSGPHAGTKERDRFRREAESAAKLDHPHVVRIYEVGETDGHPYCAMEYVGGGNLADRPKDTLWPPRRAAEFIGLLARAAHHAHDRGIVHRDLKPANILLQSVDLNGTRSDGSTADSGRSGPRISPGTPRPKIADFGLAKVLEGSDVGTTRTGDLVGTPAYMAPEQAAGRRGTVGPTTDVWALGVLLYELLTGHLPFQGESTAETLLLVSDHEPIAPRQLRPQLPQDLQTVCMKCLSKAPAGRYDSASDLADDLDRWLVGVPIPPAPSG